MHSLISLLMAIAPSIVLVCYFYKQDIRKPEPKGLVTRIFFIGVIFTIPASILEVGLDWLCESIISSALIYNLLKAFVIAALIEELIKLIIIRTFAFGNTHFDEVVDGIIYTIVASLGFACLENVIYVIEGGPGIALVRAFTAVPMHAIASGIMGYYIGRAKFAQDRSGERALIFKGLLYAILIHGLYNFLLFESSQAGHMLAAGVFPVIVYGFFNLKNKIRLAIEDDARSGRHHPEASDLAIQNSGD